jgi:hypothetical protein
VCSSQPYQVCCLRSSHRRLRLPLSSPPWEELEGMKSDHSTILSRANTRTYTIGRWDLAVLQLIALKHLAHVAACGFPQRIQSLLNPIGGETSGTRGVVQPEVVVGVGTRGIEGRQCKPQCHPSAPLGPGRLICLGGDVQNGLEVVPWKKKGSSWTFHVRLICLRAKEQGPK